MYVPKRKLGFPNWKINIQKEILVINIDLGLIHKNFKQFDVF